jgi:hypothetical protein
VYGYIDHHLRTEVRLNAKVVELDEMMSPDVQVACGVMSLTDFRWVEGPTVGASLIQPRVGLD